jgi:hypothetical protein
MTVDLGFREKGILLAFFDMSRLRLPTGQIKTFKRELLDDIRSSLQVRAAATTTNVLIGGGMFSFGIRAGAVDDWSRFAWVSPGYLETLQIPLLAGRDFNAGDTETSPKVALVNQTFVHRFFANTDPIGKTFRTSPEPDYPETEYQIIGVIKDTKYFNLRGENPAMSYAPASQDPATWPSSVMYMRSSVPLDPLGAAIGRRLGESHPQMGMQFRAFQTHIEEGLIRERLMAALSGFFGVLAALLATIGLYGVMAYMMVRRRNEIGISHGPRRQPASNRWPRHEGSGASAPDRRGNRRRWLPGVRAHRRQAPLWTDSPRSADFPRRRGLARRRCGPRQLSARAASFSARPDDRLARRITHDVTEAHHCPDGIVGSVQCRIDPNP